MLRENRSAQFLAGVFVLYTAWCMFSNGFFDAWLYPPEDGESEVAELMPMAISAVVSSVQLIGLLALSLVAGLQKPVEQLMGNLGSLVFKKSKPACPEACPSQLEDLARRIDAIEQIISKP